MPEDDPTHIPEGSWLELLLEIVKSDLCEAESSSKPFPYPSFEQPSEG